MHQEVQSFTVLFNNCTVKMAILVIKIDPNEQFVTWNPQKVVAYVAVFPALIGAHFFFYHATSILREQNVPITFYHYFEKKLWYGK